ncbi:DUF411 domain-containing protein [Patescibacteria group bacterium]
MQNKIIAGVVVALIIIAGGFYIFSKKTENNSDSGGEVLSATVHKSPNCGCCLGHAGYMKDEGIEVETIAESNMNSVKAKHNIPHNMQSCHTTEIGEYFVEGHVPIEAINKLLTEKPDIDGITLPDMPSGSPGMPGPKREDFVVYSLEDGVSEEFMRL